MITRTRRILSLVLAICLCLSMLPTVALQANAAPTVFSQLDSRWANHQYGYSNTAGTTPTTIGKGGCGILALVNAVYYMNGNFIDPIALADWSVNNGYRVNGVGTSHGLYPAYSNAYGGTYGFSCSSSTGTSSWDTLTSHLQNGGAAIVPTVTRATGSAHLLVIADYNSSNQKYLVLDSYASSNRGTSGGYAWMTKATFLDRMSCSKFILLSNTSGFSGTHTHSYSGSHYEAAHPHKVYQKCSCGATQYTGATTTVSTCETCNPVSTSSKYNAVLSFCAYLKGTSTVYPYTTAQLVTTSGGEIWSTDECTISAVYSNGACKVTYPAGSTTKTAYTQLSNFIGDTSASLTQQTVSRQVTTYIRASTGSTVYGYVSAGDVIYKLGSSGGMTQIFYPTSSGYKLAWVVTSELTEPTYDNRFNPYCPIKGYPCATSDFNVYASDRTTVTGEIWTTDYCTINAVYADGWCQVSYPAGSTTKTAYTQLSNFVYNVSAAHVKYTANAQIQVHKNKSLPGDLSWYISSGDQFFVVGSYGSASQVLYPIDAQYGGGYKLGWVSTSNLPKTTYTVSYNANGGSGAPSSQTKTHGVALTLSSTVPTRSGYAFVGWATSSSATAATYAPGSSYTTDANLTLYAVWTLNKYEISYNANGGTNVPATQNKAHGTNLTLSSVVPTKHYTVTFNANGGTVDVSSRQINCEFLGWATSSTATTAAYQPGGTFTTNANTTLYAVWQNNTLGAYSVPVREGYVFDGWYTAASGGTQVTLSTVVSSNMTVYAHWVVATYGVNYDANGGTGAPESQIKTHGKNLTLSLSVPTRSGYTFLGWATEENPESVQYQPGDIYSADSDIMLIAVWEQAALSKIEVVSKPTKTSYYVGDMLDDTGLTLKATYSDGTTKTISEGFSCTPTTLNAAGTQTITVSYGGKTATFTVTVKELPAGAMSVSKVSGAPGETVTVTIKLDSNPGIIAARLKIAYDSNVLTLLEVMDGGILGENVFGGDLTANPYTVTWENGLATSDYTATGTLVYLTFKIAEDAPIGELPITVSYDPEEIYNKDETNVAFTITQGAVTVEEAEEVDPNAVQIVVDSETASCGSTVEIDVEIVNNPGFSVLNVAFIYDTEYLTLLEVENHLSSMTMTSDSTVVWDAVENYTGNGVLCTLKFEIAEDAPDGEYEIQVIFISASNDEFEELNMSGVSGTLEICNILYGDVNGDGKIASVDLAMLRKYLASVDPITGTSSIAVKAGADCNGDGKITSVDLAMLRKYLASVDPITGESTVILGPR